MHRSPALWVNEQRAKLAEEARDWGVPSWVATALLLFPFGGLAALIGGRVIWPGAYAWLMGEDHLVEWATSVAWFLAALVALALGIRLMRQGRKLLGCLWLLVGLVAVFSGGEEISWGQRVFGFGTPEGLERRNEQGEVTIHNLSAVESLLRVAMLTVGVYGSFFTYAVRARLRGKHKATVDLLLPPVFLSSAFLLMAIYRIGWAVLLAPEPLRQTPSSTGEWAEFCVPFALLIFALLNLRRPAPSPDAGAR